MDIRLSITGSPKIIETYIKCASPENDSHVTINRNRPEEITIKVDDVKLSSIYSITDEFLKIFEIVEKICEDYS